MVLIPKPAILCNVNVSYNSQIKDTFTYIVYDLSMLAQAVTFLISIREVSSSNIGYTTDYPEWHLSQFSSPPTHKYWDNTLNEAFPSASLQLIIHYHPSIVTYLLTYLLTYLPTYLLHGAESFLRS
jgi:hypothetical protein